MPGSSVDINCGVEMFLTSFEAEKLTKDEQRLIEALGLLDLTSRTLVNHLIEIEGNRSDEKY